MEDEDKSLYDEGNEDEGNEIVNESSEDEQEEGEDEGINFFLVFLMHNTTLIFCLKIFLQCFIDYFLILHHSLDSTVLCSMAKCWEKFEPPKAEKDLVGEWVGCVYETPKRAGLFVGKVTRRFLSDDGAALNAFTTALEVDCLEEKLGTTDCLFKENERKDVGIFAIHNVICGPIKANFLGGRKWDIPQYQQIRKIFDNNKKNDRAKAHSKYLKTILVDEE